jgi:hypothetical protein
MTASLTRSADFTITDARYVGAKIGTDLRLLNNYYGKPSLEHIGNLAEEVALLLNDGYLDTVDYGFRDADKNSWRLRLRYRAATGGQLVNVLPGGLPSSTAIGDLPFYSYLAYNSTFHALTGAERAAVEEALPISRQGADAPGTGAGATTPGHGYARHGSGVTRDVYVAF